MFNIQFNLQVTWLFQDPIEVEYQTNAKNIKTL